MNRHERRRDKKLNPNKGQEKLTVNLQDRTGTIYKNGIPVRAGDLVSGRTYEVRFEDSNECVQLTT